MEVTLNNIPITLTRKRGLRGVRISIKTHDSKVNVTYGWFITESFAHTYVKSKLPWIEEKLAKLSKINPVLKTKHTKQEVKKFSVLALKLVKSRLEYFNQYYNFDYNKISIKNQKTKWGSCSSKKNLNFSYKIIFLPKELQDYLIVHELCHLKEMNHGKVFWRLVAEQIEDYKSKSKKLRIGDF
jgi:predicted metal-dependent hydrolase